MPDSRTLKIIFNLFMVYAAWGTLYLFNKNTIAVFGPFLTCGFRTFMGGVCICLYLFFRKKQVRPSKNDIFRANLLGFFMVTVGAGFLSKGQESVLSSTAALITASVPITMLVSGWLFAGEPCPEKKQWAGLFFGFLGLAIIALTQNTENGTRLNPYIGTAWLFTATLGWIAGTLLTRRFPAKTRLPALQNCAFLLIFGGMQTFLIGLFLGEYENTAWDRVNAEIILSLAWLSLGGSVIAYSCYFWLISHTSIAVAVSYEYVVPVISLAVGYFFGNEPINTVTVSASAMTIGSVFFIVQKK